MSMIFSVRVAVHLIAHFLEPVLSRYLRWACAHLLESTLDKNAPLPISSCSISAFLISSGPFHSCHLFVRTSFLQFWRKCTITSSIPVDVEFPSHKLISAIPVLNVSTVPLPLHTNMCLMCSSSELHRGH